MQLGKFFCEYSHGGLGANLKFCPLNAMYYAVQIRRNQECISMHIVLPVI